MPITVAINTRSAPGKGREYIGIHGLARSIVELLLDELGRSSDGYITKQSSMHGRLNYGSVATSTVCTSITFPPAVSCLDAVYIEKKLALIRYCRTPNYAANNPSHRKGEDNPS